MIATPAAHADLRSMAHRFDAAADLQNGPDAVQVRFGPLVVDALAYGDAPGGEGAPAEDVAPGFALARDAASTDTDDNAADFEATAPTPGRAPGEACFDLCDPGAVRCVGGLASRCAVLAGCAIWTPSADCDAAGGICVEGACLDAGPARLDVRCTRLDGDLTPQAIVRRDDGGWYVAAVSDACCDGQASLLRLAPDGGLDWAITLGDAAKTIGGMALVADGGVVLAGSVVGLGAGGDDAWIMRVGPDGMPRWARVFGGLRDDTFVDVVFDGRRLLAVGSSDSARAGAGNSTRAGVVAIALDVDGGVAWQRIFDAGLLFGRDVGWEDGHGVIPLDGGWWLVGMSNTWEAGIERDVLLVRVGAEGELIRATAIETADARVLVVEAGADGELLLAGTDGRSPWWCR